jgi:hypothetical protein
MLHKKLKLAVVFVASLLILGVAALNLSALAGPVHSTDEAASVRFQVVPPLPPKPAVKPKPPDVLVPAPGDPGKIDPKKNPPPDAKEVKVASFHTIVLYGMGKVFVKQTGKESVTIKGDKNLTAAATAQVQNGTLQLQGGGFAGGFGGIGPLPGGGIGGGAAGMPFPGAGGFGGVVGNPGFGGGVAGVQPFPGGAVAGGGFAGGGPGGPGVGVAGNAGFAGGAAGFGGMAGGANIGFGGGPAPGANPFPGGGAGLPGGGVVGGGGFPGGVNPFAIGPNVPMVEFHIDVKDLKGLAILGTGRMDVTNVETKQLMLMIGGTGDLAVAGKVDDLQVFVSGSGSLEGSDLKAGKATVSHHGFGKATVYVVGTLQVTVTGVGTVEYLGNPQVQKQILGIGKVVPKQ